MATIRLVPSTIYNGSSSYLTISSATNANTNTDSTTYATIQNTRSSTSSYYIYIRGFNFNDVPDNAIVSNISIKIKAYHSGGNTSTIYAYDGTSTQISTAGSTTALGTSASVKTFTNTTIDWDTLKSYGSNFGIRINCRRSSRNTTSYIYVYGAEIEVTYTVPEPRTITSTLTGSGTINPSGAQTYYDRDEYNLTITPTNQSDTVTVTNNGVDVTSQLEAHYTGGTSTSYSTASGTEVTTGFARSGSAFYQSSSTQSDAWLRYAIGHTAENPYSTSNTSNTYVKDGTNDATTQGWMNYPFSFSNLPEDAEITAVEIKCYGAIENASQSASHADISLWCGNTQKGTMQRFTSTSNSTITIDDPGEWTRDELQNAWVRFGVGYYGGRLLGITWKVTYTYGGTLHHYTYSYEVNGNATIAVTIGNGSTPSQKIYFKNNGTWAQYSKVYVKQNGSWVEQPASNWSSIFDTSANYVKSN